VWRNTGVGCNIGILHSPPFNFVNLVAFGNGAVNCTISVSPVVLNSPVLSGDSTFATTYGIRATSGTDLKINNGSLGVASGIKVAHSSGDFHISNNGPMRYRIVLYNTVLGSSVEVTSPSYLQDLLDSYISSVKHDGQAGCDQSLERCRNNRTCDRANEYRTAQPGERWHLRKRLRAS